ncbi:GAF domain-containing protein, partial [Microbacterium sp. ARD31]
MIKTALTSPIPPRQHESRRLAALHRLQLLDTPPDPAFERIAQLAQTLFDVPIALISLLDEDRQWFKARCGLDVPGTPREQAFCNYTILHDSVFVVPDARSHADFALNPLVTGEPFIRFYAGAPLVVAPEIRLGSLCIIDKE